MTMTYDEVAELLAFCAVHDKRKGDDLDIKAWLMVATDHRWTAELALRVAREHYGSGAHRGRLEAPAITDRIRDIRRKAAESFEDPRIPDNLAAKDYPKWLRARQAEHIDALTGRWAAGGDEPPALPPPPPTPNEVGQRRVAALIAGAFQEIPPERKADGSDGGAKSRPVVEMPPERHAALAVTCPYCDARPKQPCTREAIGGRVRMPHPHPARYAAGSAEEAS